MCSSDLEEPSRWFDMSTTTTKKPHKDTYLDSSRVTRNYGTQTTMRSGTSYSHGAYTCYNMVMEFDVSAYTDPSAIIQADLTLISQGVVGGTTSTITVARLGIEFAAVDAAPVDGCTWNDTGDYNPPAAPIDWVGGTTYAETDVPLQTFVVGSGQSDVTIDLIDFMRDAITRRSGVLRLLLSDGCDSTGGGAFGYTKFYSTRHTTSSNHPVIEIIVADRVVWNGAAGDGVISSGDRKASCRERV